MSATREPKRWLTPQERTATELRSIASVSSPYVAKRLRIAADMLETAVGVKRELAAKAAPTPVLLFAHVRCRWCDMAFDVSEGEEFAEHVASVHNTEWLASEDMDEDLVDQAVASLARNRGLGVVLGPGWPTKKH
jgi:hypothetical protein